MTAPLDEQRLATKRFYWTWLRLAAIASVAGNVADAVLSDPPSVVVAVTLAIVPPAWLLAATHGVSRLVRAGIGGRVYQWSVAGTVFLGAVSAYLSFRALAHLASHWAAFPPIAALLVPVALDAAIAVATLGLLALDRPAATAVLDAPAPEPAPEAEAPAEEVAPLADIVPIPKRPDETRELTVRFRVSQSEQAELEDLAAHLDRLPAEAARDVVLAAARRPRSNAA
ncbi:hypothetical protein ACFV6Y_39325 [Streptomyces massasporeus]|uniref:hypothetical protein n=1 Tax=Streptomyces massasporeus TaxID=67324 RepID=UPI00364A7FD1